MPRRGLLDGYFGASRHFETITREAAFARGVGLAGSVWNTGLPLLIPEIAESTQFARNEVAEAIGFHRAIGWPCASSLATKTLPPCIGPPPRSRLPAKRPEK